MSHYPDRSWITDCDPAYPEGVATSGQILSGTQRQNTNRQSSSNKKYLVWGGEEPAKQ